MTWLFPHIWLWVLLSFLLGFAITLLAMVGRTRTAPASPKAGDRAQPFPAAAATAEPTSQATAGVAAPPGRHRSAQTVEDPDPLAAAPAAPAAVIDEGADASAVESPERPPGYDVDDVEVNEWAAGQTFEVPAP